MEAYFDPSLSSFNDQCNDQQNSFKHQFYEIQRHLKDKRDHYIEECILFQENQKDIQPISNLAMRMARLVPSFFNALIEITLLV